MEASAAVAWVDSKGRALTLAGKRIKDATLRDLRLAPNKEEARLLVEPGLFLHVRRRQSGGESKHWQYRAQVDGKRRWLSLGAYPDVGLDKAKAELVALGIAHEAAKRGDADHPVVARKAALKATKELATVQAVFDDWIADKRLGSARIGGRPVSERTIAILTENFEADVCDRIGALKIAKVTRADLQACIDAPRRRAAPGAAAQVYRMLRGLLRFATERDHVPGADPMRGIKNPKPYSPPTTPGEVNAATDTELRLFLAALDASSISPSAKMAVEFQLLTGARPGEVREATWDEIDALGGAWVIPAARSKMRRAFRVHLSVQAQAVVARARELRTTSQFIFPGGHGRALEKMAVARALARLSARTVAEGVRKLRPHDLRRTFRTLLGRIGVAPHVAEMCIAHVEKEAMRRVYDGHDYSAEMAAAWDRAGAHIAALMLT